MNERSFERRNAVSVADFYCMGNYYHQGMAKNRLDLQSVAYTANDVGISMFDMAEVYPFKPHKGFR